MRAGLGTAPMAHATTSEREPVKQALYGILKSLWIRSSSAALPV